jgi:hypothetical protein
MEEQPYSILMEKDDWNGYLRSCEDQSPMGLIVTHSEPPEEYPVMVFSDYKYDNGVLHCDHRFVYVKDAWKLIDSQIMY